MTGDSALAEQFRRDWARYYPTCLPLGWMLRSCSKAPWVRFHALPGSKRYAEDQAERSIIRSRANALADWLLGEDELCWVIEADTDDLVARDGAALSGRETDDPDDPVWSFYIQHERWRAGARDAKLLSIADDEPRRAVWMRCDNGAVFAPYDGGFDLFPASWKAVRQLKAAWPDWLSNHPAGL